MILKASKRGGATDLGKHLLKAENEHVEVHEVRGFVADDVIGALKEAYAISRGTKCRKFLFSMSLSPPEGENVPIEAFEEAIATVESSLGLTDQPRVIVFHEKEGRRHAHCVWSRVKAETMTAVDLPHFKFKLMDISRQLYLEHGWKMPTGMIDPALRSPLSFDRKEWFQAERTGQDPRNIKAALQQCWSASDSGKALRQALEQRGYYLARGDRRAVVAIDIHGEVYALARWIGVRSKDVVSRIGDLSDLPSLEQAKQQVAVLVKSKLQGFAGALTDDFALASKSTEAKRLAMTERHRSDRRVLRSDQEQRWHDEALARSERYRKGLLGLWDRVSGRHGKIKQQNELETKEAAARDRREHQALIERQLNERQRLQQEIRQMRNLYLHRLTRINRRLAGIELNAIHEFNSDGPSDRKRRHHRHAPQP